MNASNEKCFKTQFKLKNKPMYVTVTQYTWLNPPKQSVSGSGLDVGSSVWTGRFVSCNPPPPPLNPLHSSLSAVSQAQIVIPPNVGAE